jgi:hypothetical protein
MSGLGAGKSSHLLLAGARPAKIKGKEVPIEKIAQEVIKGCAKTSKTQTKVAIWAQGTTAPKPIYNCSV